MFNYYMIKKIEELGVKLLRTYECYCYHLNIVNGITISLCLTQQLYRRNVSSICMGSFKVSTGDADTTIEDV